MEQSTGTEARDLSYLVGCGWTPAQATQLLALLVAGVHGAAAVRQVLGA